MIRRALLRLPLLPLLLWLPAAPAAGPARWRSAWSNVAGAVAGPPGRAGRPRRR
jgi:hypothetical protein